MMLGLLYLCLHDLQLADLIHNLFFFTCRTLSLTPSHLTHYTEHQQSSSEVLNHHGITNPSSPSAYREPAATTGPSRATVRHRLTSIAILWYAIYQLHVLVVTREWVESLI
ncbi:hypothetical protein VNO78_07376 [Psophocarpus tetragonolobus]|uniref:Uncharacterized protein n=1 Tax=Psophocarpus tetragonolobus TaxID=3891 RepID=A0AAN9SUI4_PSOTE